MLKNENIICISWLVWDSIPLVMHQMMTRLARNNRVLFVDPPFPITRFIMDPKKTKRYLYRVVRWQKGVKKVSNNLWIYYPPPLIIFYGRVKYFDRFNQWYLTRCIRKVAKYLRFHRPILWLYHPYAILPNGSLNEKAVCYDCNDNIGSFFYRLSYQKQRLSALEGELVRKADIVFTTSQNLYNEKRKLNKNTYYYPSGTDVELFSRVMLPQTQISDEIATLKRPIIGFIGGMTRKKMAWEWVEKLATFHSEWSLVFIGPVDDSLPQEIIRCQNIYFLGRKPMEALPHYVRGFDICIIPYREGDFLQSCFPTKVFEFLAAAKPIVTSDIPALRDYASVIRVAKDAGEFVSHIEDLLEKGLDAEIRKKGLTIAQSHTWDARVEKTSALISELLG